MYQSIDIDKIIKEEGKSSPKRLYTFCMHGSNEEPICQPYDYLSGLPSNNNNIRRKFIELFHELFFQEEDYTHKKAAVNEVISLLHNSSLLIDDIEDNSKYRRGFPSAHVKYGKPLTINCANLMYFRAMETAAGTLDHFVHADEAERNLRSRDLNRDFVYEMTNLHEGQGLDIYWRDFLPELHQLPTIEEYLTMVQNKTGGLFRLSVRLLDVFKYKRLEEEKLDKVIAIANLAGIIYQIRDDYLNLVDARYSTMKGIAGEDLIEGKLSLPILINLRDETDPTNSPVHKILYEFRSLKLRSKQSNLLQKAVTYLHEKGSMSQTHTMLAQFKQKFHSLLAEFGYGNSELYKLIETLCDV